MGWLFYNRPRGESDFDHFNRKVFVWSQPEAADYKLVASATVDRQVFYGVLEMNAERKPDFIPDENGKVRICVICLIKWVPNDHYNFGYKDMDETSGPCDTTCPEKILDMLSEIRPEALAASQAKFAAAEAAVAAGTEKWAWGDGLLNAHKWRQACRERIKVRKATRVIGTRFKLKYPMRFTDGVEAVELIVSRIYRNRPIFTRPDGMAVSVKRTAFSQLSLA